MYYNVMANNPSLLHKFYLEESTMTRSKVPFTGKQEIQVAIDHYHGKSENVHTNVLKLTPSPAENSILLFVSGVFTVDGAKSKFHQTFLLKFKEENVLYVSADILVFHDVVFADEDATEEAAENQEEPVEEEAPVEEPATKEAKKVENEAASAIVEPV